MISMPRWLLIVALLGVAIACISGAFAGGQPTRTQVLRSLALSSLDELAFLAGVADESGQLQRDTAMELEVVSEGGPMWSLTAVEDAVERSPHFAVGASPHILRTEIINERGALALQLHLWRAGWELREPKPSRARVAPWAAVLGAVLGAVVALFGGRLSIGLATAGITAQLALNFDPLPRGLFPPQRLAEAWSSGPLGRRVLGWVQGMGTLELAVVLALLAASLVLVAFDHRRTRGNDEDLSLGGASFTALLGTIGGLCWLEAASRGSLFAACDLRFGAYLGLVALFGLILAWLPAIRVARESWRA